MMADCRRLRFLFRDFFVGRHGDGPSADNDYFCSELVAHTLMEVGVLATRHPPNAYDPNTNIFHY